MENNAYILPEKPDGLFIDEFYCIRLDGVIYKSNKRSHHIFTSIMKEKEQLLDAVLEELKRFFKKHKNVESKI